MGRMEPPPPVRLSAQQWMKDTQFSSYEPYQIPLNDLTLVDLAPERSNISRYHPQTIENLCIFNNNKCFIHSLIELLEQFIQLIFSSNDL